MQRKKPMTRSDKIQEIQALSAAVNWPVEAHATFLKGKGDADWETAKESTLDKALNHLRSTVEMFGIEVKPKLKIHNRIRDKFGRWHWTQRDS